MNTRSVRYVLIHSLVGILLLTGLGIGQAQIDPSAILTPFTNETVLPTYAELDQRADTLVAAVGALTADGGLTTENLLAARVAWLAARVPWERSEAFLYGPADTAGIDPRIDTWPVDVNQLLAIIDPATGPPEFTQAVLDDLVNTGGEGVVGFHVIEYLLFVDASGNHDLDDVVAAMQAEPRRAAYLAALGADFKTQTLALTTAWDPAGGNFAAMFIAGGLASLQEMVGGMIAIADEVSNPEGKLAATSPQELESASSGNTLTDVLNNILGISETYGYASATVATISPDADAAVRDNIRTAVAAIAKIPAPLRDSLDLSAAEVQAAIDAVTQLRMTLEQIAGAIPAP